MSRIESMEQQVHGRARDASNEDEIYFGVHEVLLAARVTQPVVGAQWGGVVTTLACSMLENGEADAVLCVGSEAADRFAPRAVLARTPEQVLACRGVKPVVASLLELLPLVDQNKDVRRLVVCGVGCQIQAFRSIEKHLGLDQVFIIGTNCVDNAPSRKALDKFLHVASCSPQTVTSYEFMADYNVHISHARCATEPSLAAAAAVHEGARDTPVNDNESAPKLEGGGVDNERDLEIVPYFTLPAHELKDVIAPSCYSCFDYSNAMADAVVGYMAAPHERGTPMQRHAQVMMAHDSFIYDMPHSYVTCLIHM